MQEDRSNNNADGFDVTFLIEYIFNRKFFSIEYIETID